MDRIDMVIDVGRIDPSLLMQGEKRTPSEEMRTHVLAGRAFADERGLFSAAPIRSDVASNAIASFGLDAPAMRLLEASARAQCLSGRAVVRMLRVARTIADIEQSMAVRSEHISEALGFRLGGLA